MFYTQMEICVMLMQLNNGAQKWNGLNQESAEKSKDSLESESGDTPCTMP